MTRRGVILLAAIVVVLVIGVLVFFGEDIVHWAQGRPGILCGCLEHEYSSELA